MPQHRSEMLQAEARVSDLPYPVFRTRATHSSDGPSQALLPCPMAHDLVERYGGSDSIYAFPRLNYPRLCWDGGELPTPRDQPSVTALHLLAPVDRNPELSEGLPLSATFCVPMLPFGHTQSISRVWCVWYARG